MATSSIDDFDVEKYRQKHECLADWKLRRAFLISNREYLDNEDQLVCMANCYINVNCYGCSYPPEVMDKLNKLEKNVDRTLVSDFKPSSSHDLPSADLKRKSVEGSWRNPPSRNEATNRSQLPSTPLELSHLLRRFSNLAAKFRELKASSNPSVNIVSLLQMAIDKTKLTASQNYINLPKGNFACVLLIECVQVSEGEAANKKQAKVEAFQNAVAVLEKPRMEIQKSKNNPEEFILVGSLSDNLTINSEKKCKLSLSNKELPRLDFNVSNFILISHLSSHNNAVSLLKQSADFNKSELKFEIQPDTISRGEITCHVTLDGRLLCRESGDTKQEATASAAELALSILKKYCSTIVVKQSCDADFADAVQKDAFTESDGNSPSGYNPIPESNIGNKLLRMMGWSGGGVGRSGNEGIVNPIAVEGIINREGLGLRVEKGIAADFQHKISQLVQEYLVSDKQEDLIFSPTFMKEERSIIHRIGQKFHLRSKSYSKDEDRFLVLSRRRSPLELLNHIVANGGETHRYLLVPPTGLVKTADCYVEIRHKHFAKKIGEEVFDPRIQPSKAKTIDKQSCDEDGRSELNSSSQSLQALIHADTKVTKRMINHDTGSFIDSDGVFASPLSSNLDPKPAEGKARKKIVWVLKRVNLAPLKINNGSLVKSLEANSQSKEPTKVDLQSLESTKNSLQPVDETTKKVNNVLQDQACGHVSQTVPYIISSKDLLISLQLSTPSLMLSPSSSLSVPPSSTSASATTTVHEMAVSSTSVGGSDKGVVSADVLPLGLKMAANDLPNYRCSRCGHQAFYEQHLREHLVMYHSDDLVTCQCCDFLCLEPTNLQLHYKQFHPKCYCEECGFTTKHGYVLRRHKQSHSEEGRWCSECKKFYKDRYVLKMHKKMVHSDIEKSFKCLLCSKEFNRKAHLKRHIRTHDPERPYCCPFPDCLYKGCEKSDISKHMLIHNEPKYECEVCHKLFRHTKNRDLHAKRHKGQKDYKCGVCDFYGYTFTDIRKHIERKHIKLGFQSCEKCAQIFTTELDKEDHNCSALEVSRRNVEEEEEDDDECSETVVDIIKSNVDDKEEGEPIGEKSTSSMLRPKRFHVVNINQLDDSSFTEESLQMYEIQMPKSELAFSDDDC